MNIIGKSEVTAVQMAAYLIDKNPNARSFALPYAKLYLEEGEVEGVRGDGAWIQSCKETGNFTYTGGTAVTFDQNNFCGLGVTKKGMKGHSFDTPRLGIRAQMQHLKGYATTEPLVNPCIDPRYGYISPKGKAPRFEDLAGKWAVPGYNTKLASSLEDAMNKGIGYGFDIIAGIEKMKAINVTENEVKSPEETKDPIDVEPIYYIVQSGCYSNKVNAIEQKNKLEEKKFTPIIKEINSKYYVQLGVYKDKTLAEIMKCKAINSGFSAFIKESKTIDGTVVKVETPTESTVEPNKGVEVKVGYKVAIDAGHGSNTAGKRTPDGYREHWINVKCANYTDIALRRCGFETLKVAWNDTNATDDTDVALGTRQSQIKAAKCDASVSIHANAMGNGKEFTSAKGVETFGHSDPTKLGDSLRLARCVQDALLQGTTQTNRGVKTANLAMCNCIAMGTKASVLTELGFMTNKYEAELMKTDAFCLESAEEIAQGVCKYFGVTYVKPGSSPVVVTPSTPSTPATKPTNADTYTVQKGDWLSKIGEKTGIDWEVIAKLNGITEPWIIKVGQVLKLKETPNVNTLSVPLKVNATKKAVQTFLNTYYGTEIKKVLGELLAVDGEFGNLSKLALGIAFQVELNKLGANLTVDGKIGNASASAFSKLVGTLKKGSKGIFVTLWQCILVGYGIDPNGIDGDFGSGCATATNKLFDKIGLTKDASVSGADLNALL